MAEPDYSMILNMDPMSSQALGALVGGFLIALVVLLIAYYIYNSLALMVIAKRLGVQRAWLAWIPIANVYLMTQMAGISGWWTFALLIGLIPTLGSLLLVAGFLYLWWQIVPKLGKPSWWAILLLIPVVNLVVLGILAWGGKGASSAPAVTKKAPAKKSRKK